MSFALSRPRWLGVLLAFAAAPALAAPFAPLAPAGIPAEFLLFGLTLLGVALFQNHSLAVGLSGLTAVSLYKGLCTDFSAGAGLSGWLGQVGQEWVTLVNLLALLLGFALLSRHFEKTRLPALLPRFLPRDWKGGFLLLVMVFVLSSFLDNIAAALIGGAMAHQLFRAKVHVGYLAALVAAANAGGAGSVVGDTTTTMMWIDGIAPAVVLDAYIAAGVALVLVGVVAARQQHAYSPILHHAHQHVQVDWLRLALVGAILLAAAGTNVVVNTAFPAQADRFPFLGAAVWLAILVTAGLRRPDWEVLPQAFTGALFLLSLVLCASMMPVANLPEASWQTAFGLGFVSAVFDNIPLTALALKQGGYDWGFLAFAVGFGGSMVWFGSSAGVALCNLFPEGRSVGRWLRYGWPVAVAYVVGFTTLLLVLGWHPDAPHKAVPTAVALRN